MLSSAPQSQRWSQGAFVVTGPRLFEPRHSGQGDRKSFFYASLSGKKGIGVSAGYLGAVRGASSTELSRKRAQRNENLTPRGKG